MYTERDSKIGRCQGGAQNLGQAKPALKQLNLKSLAMQADHKFCGCPTQVPGSPKTHRLWGWASAEPIFESRAVYSEKQMGALEQMETLHFWSRARRQLILDRLISFAKGKRVLDVGCGTGLLVHALKEKGFEAVGIDPQPAFFRPSLPLFKAKAEKIPFEDGSFDALIMADVLEHLEEKEPLTEAFRVLAPKGILLLTVPAFSWAWSRRDDEAGHLRRYHPKEMGAIADRYHAKLIDLQFYQFFLFPLFLLSRLCRLSPGREVFLPGLINHLFYQINLLELRLGKWIRWPWGSSLIAVIEKNEPI